MSSGKINKPKNKHFYTKSNRKRANNIDVNFKGFLCSCNNREKDCVRESYNILNKAVDMLYGKVAEVSVESNKSEQIDISDEVAKEVENLKSRNPNSEHKFNLYDSGAKNLIFIRTTLDSPVEIAEYIVKDIHETKQQQTRFLIRLVPIETTCKAYIDDIEKAFDPLAEKYFKNEARTFSIVYNHRNNNSLSKDEVIQKIAEKISSMGKHKVSLKEAEVSVIVEVIKGFAFMSVIPNYLKYKKYNLLSISENIESANQNDINPDSKLSDDE